MKAILTLLFFIPIMVFSQEKSVIINPDTLKNKIYDEVGIEAEFPGGDSEMKRFLATHVIYPNIAMENGDQGKVYIEFIVNIDGSLEGIYTMRGVSEELDNEAMRVIRLMPNWIPAELDGAKVRAKCRVPINFVLVGSNRKAERKLRKSN